MFDDPQVLIGAVIGILIIAAGAAVGVNSHRRRERQERESGR